MNWALVMVWGAVVAAAVALGVHWEGQKNPPPAPAPAYPLPAQTREESPPPPPAPAPEPAPEAVVVPPPAAPAEAVPPASPAVIASPASPAVIASPVRPGRAPAPAPPQEKPVRVTARDCAALVRHQPAADVTYQPGRDVYGRPVVPADLESGSHWGEVSTWGVVLTLPITPLTLNGQPVATAQEGRLVYDVARGILTLDGVPLTAPQNALITAACQQAGR